MGKRRLFAGSLFDALALWEFARCKYAASKGAFIMGLVATFLGIISLASVVFAAAWLMNQLGAGEAAKGLLFLTAVGFAAAVIITYGSALFATIG